jgi:phosphopantothenate---cysteine ligase (CTP)
MKILITSGGTKIMLDSVRHIGNMSKGTFGSAICKEFLERFHYVDFLMAEGSKTPFTFTTTPNSLSKNDCYRMENEFEEWLDFAKDACPFYHECKYKTFDDYKFKIERLLKNNKYDMVILAAAVSDFGVENVVDGKMRSNSDMEIKLKALPKIISGIKKWQPNTFLVGFKLLVNSNENELIKDAKSSIEKNGCDVVVANDLRDIRANNHKLFIVKQEEDCDKKQYFIVVERTKDESERNCSTLAGSLVDTLIDSYNRKNKIV